MCDNDKSIEMEQKVVIIGHSYLSRLALIRSLGQTGYDVTVIVTMYGRLNKRKQLDCFSKYVRRVYYCNAKDEIGLIKILLEHCTDPTNKVVIIPDSDFSAAFVDKNKECLSTFFRFPHISENNVFVADLMDKKWQKNLAHKVGLNVPLATVLHVRNGIVPKIDHVHFPCFTKALTTMGGGKQWFRKCEDKRQLIGALDEFAGGKDADFLIEDYINVEEEFAVVGLSDGGTVIIPGVIQFVENCQCHLGIARKGKLLPVAGFESLIELFKEYVKETHFIGLFDIDFLYSNNEYFFCEINFRYGGSGYAYTLSGINLPTLYVQMMIGRIQLRDLNMEVTEEMAYVNERMLLDDLKARNITICDFKQSIFSPDNHFISDDKDNKPVIVFHWLVIKGIIIYFLKGLLRRQS